MDSLIKALGPAFAAGFAVQRLLEIVDALLSARGRPPGRVKPAVLGVVSLVVGVLLACAGKLRVLLPLGSDLDATLGANLAAFVDYLVTGLIISAGTEGFNSILKFLNYKKEEKKAEAVEQKTEALNTLARSDIAALGLRPSQAARVLSMSFDDFTSVSDQLKDALKAEILKNKDFKEKFIEDGWEDRAFGDFTNHLDAVRIAVSEATAKVASDLGTSVPDSIMAKLQKKVGLDTTPSDILPQMRIVIG
jgi:hypothetical protein